MRFFLTIKVVNVHIKGESVGNQVHNILRLFDG